ncbi:hypothetical protein DNH61_24580 [Paenibacillus sambharensis]|uniref:Aminoglycoside phosphotransferase domain-containing protein n=1 Tax=Paenibacillus sambharensis TaxID=1803190 RepID=A0A2W1LDT6_9BACL|nr:macrolide 2'-phosphotransferase [Paenibacillus sambharensis]PZD93225.1 hypothetical protein DNH61_24580 [Paenibacillus sambharensis]
MKTVDRDEDGSVKQELIRAANDNGLLLNEDDLELNESGMDFLVAFAKDLEGQSWVLRKPRRADVWERALNERNALNLVRRYLPVQVPDWRICSPELIAYPLLSGQPLAVVDPAGSGYLWQVEQQALNDSFFNSLARALAALHSIDHAAAAEAGLKVKQPLEAREAFAEQFEEAKRYFDIPTPLLERWTIWLSVSSGWPSHSVLNHGDLHPPHILIDETQRVTGFIDWTEAEVGNPGKDFVIYYALFGDDGLRDLLRRYELAGGKVWPEMAQHIAEQWAAYPIQVAAFALMTGKESDMEMAQNMIDGWQV